MTTESPTPSNRPQRSFSRGGGWQTLFLFALLVLLFPIGRVYFQLLLLALLVLAVYWYIRGALCIGKRTGIVAVSLLLTVTAYTFAVQFSAYQSHKAFVASLSRFDSLTVQTDNPIPTTPIRQVSLTRNMTDEDLETLVSMPQLHLVTHLYLKNCYVTDSGLRFLEHWPKLSYVYIESRLISDDAIIDFKNEHPDCSVIPPGRDLW